MPSVGEEFVARIRGGDLPTGRASEEGLYHILLTELSDAKKYSELSNSARLILTDLLTQAAQRDEQMVSKDPEESKDAQQGPRTQEVTTLLRLTLKAELANAAHAIIAVHQNDEKVGQLGLKFIVFMRWIQGVDTLNQTFKEDRSNKKAIFEGILWVVDKFKAMLGVLEGHGEAARLDGFLKTYLESMTSLSLTKVLSLVKTLFEKQDGPHRLAWQALATQVLSSFGASSLADLQFKSLAPLKADLPQRCKALAEITKENFTQEAQLKNIQHLVTWSKGNKRPDVLFFAWLKLVELGVLTVSPESMRYKYAPGQNQAGDLHSTIEGIMERWFKTEGVLKIVKEKRDSVMSISSSGSNSPSSGSAASLNQRAKILSVASTPSSSGTNSIVDSGDLEESARPPSLGHKTAASFKGKTAKPALDHFEAPPLPS